MTDEATETGVTSPVQGPYVAYGEGARLFRWLNGTEKPPMEALYEGVAGSGKSRAIAEFIYSIISNYWGSSVLVVRKTRVDLAKSFLKIFENEVLGRNHPVILDGPSREHRMVYRHPTLKGEVVCGGMEDPTRIFSTQYDVVFWEEAIEAEKEQWESLHRALRAGPLPFRLLLGACNPDSKYHWLNQRCNEGRCMRLVGKFWDNPVFYDQERREWTEQGREYLARLSGQQTGHTRARLYEGLWVSAEGQVWPNYDPAIHLIDRSDLPEMMGHFGSKDWGYTAPGSFGVFGVDRERRIYRVASVYRTGKTLDWWATVIERLVKDYGINQIVADPSRPDSIEMLNDKLYAVGVPACVRGADNRRTSRPGAKLDMVGLDLVRWGFERDKEGKSRIYIVKNNLVEGRDPDQASKGKPCCLEEELLAYTYKPHKDGRPHDEDTDPNCDDHACDDLRQAVMHAWHSDYSPEEVKRTYRPGTWGSVLGMDEHLREAGIIE